MSNPNAHLKGLITVDDAMASPRVSWPYKLFDICPRSAGAAAVVIADERTAREVCSRPAFVTDIGAVSNTAFQGDRCVPSADCDFAEHAEIAIAARECYAQAGMTESAHTDSGSADVRPVQLIPISGTRVDGFLRARHRCTTQRR